MTAKTKAWMWILIVIIAVVVIVGLVRRPGSAERRAERAAKEQLEAYRAYRDEADPAKRVANMQRFLEKYPDSKYRGYAYANIFTTHLDDMADTAKAVEYARGVLASAEPVDGKAPLYPALMSFWLEAGVHDSVVAVAREALVASVTDGSIYNEMGYELAEAGQHLDLAVELCQKAVDLSEEDMDKSYAYDSMGWAYLKAGDATKAVEALTQAKTLAGADVDETVLAHLGEAQVAAKDAEGSIATYLEMMSMGEFSDARAELDSLYAVTKRAPESLQADIKALREKKMTAATDFSLTGADGKQVTLAGLKGKVVVLNFMSPTWGPCVAEFPRLEELAKKFTPEQMVVVAVDASNQKARTLKMVEKTGVTFGVLLDGRKVARETYKIRGTPTTYMINADGMIVFKHVGYYPGLESTLEKEVESLVGGPA